MITGGLKNLKGVDIKMTQVLAPEIPTGIEYDYKNCLLPCKDCIILPTGCFEICSI